MAKGNSFTFSSFYCPSCGKKAMDLPRPRSLIRQGFHRKKLYCPWCRTTYNCVEVRDEMERREFIEDWEAGKYEGDAEAMVE